MGIHERNAAGRRSLEKLTNALIYFGLSLHPVLFRVGSSTDTY